MKKWLGAFVISLMLVGCQGGNASFSNGSGNNGNSNGGSGSGGNGGGTPSTSINLPDTNTHVNLTILSGQGRRSLGSLYAQLSTFGLFANDLDILPPTLQVSGSLQPVRAQLDGYTVNNTGFTANLLPFTQSSSSFVGQKTVDQMNLNDDGVFQENAAGGLDPVAGSPALPRFPATGLLFPGRYENATVYMDDASFAQDPSTGAVSFNYAQWQAENYRNGNAAVQTFLADYVSFDISSMTSVNRPQMQSGTVADKFMVTGDQLGLSAGTQTVGSFNLILSNFVAQGVLTNPTTVGTDQAPGTYTIVEPNPSVLPPSVSLIAAVQGIWRPFNTVISNATAGTCILFPSSTDPTVYQFVIFNPSGSSVTALWFGTATLSSVGGTFTAYPVSAAATLDKSAITPVTGTLTPTSTVTWSPLNKNGAVITDVNGNPIVNKSPKAGTFAATGNAGAWTFGTSGKFLVFR